MSRIKIHPCRRQSYRSYHRFDLPLDARLEYLTLAVGNAKSHPVSVGSRHETAIAFLTDLEEKLEVAQVQLELFNILSPHMNDPGEIGEKVKLLSKGLMTVTEVRSVLPTLMVTPQHLSHIDRSYTKNTPTHSTCQSSNCLLYMYLNTEMRTSSVQFGIQYFRKVSH